MPQSNAVTIARLDHIIGMIDEKAGVAGMGRVNHVGFMASGYSLDASKALALQAAGHRPRNADFSSMKFD